MEYLNHEAFDAVPEKDFQNRKPYPWFEIKPALTKEGYERLLESLPDVSLFDRIVGVKRTHGQLSHDRYILHYRPQIQLATPWRGFIAELQGSSYEALIRRLFQVPESRKLLLTFEWYYAWEGCSVSPHCDAQRKLGTHIFYFNTEADWDSAWGGEILILDDSRQFRPHSAPSFDDLKVAASLDPRDNGSLLFQRTEHSWHGVRPLGCPPDRLRKLFIVTINVPTLQVWWRRLRGKDPDGYPLT